MRLLRRQPVAAGASLFLIAIVLIAILAPIVSPYDPLLADFGAGRLSPNSAHWLGTDWQGRDQLSRLFHGTRVALLAGVLAVLVGTTIGGVWGLLSGYARGLPDLLSQRFLEMLM